MSYQVLYLIQLCSIVVSSFKILTKIEQAELTRLAKLFLYGAWNISAYQLLSKMRRSQSNGWRY